VFVAVGMLSFMTATTIAIDVGMFMTARSAAQTSADAGALAGAIALVRNSYEDRTTTGPVVQSAVLTARANQIAGAVVDEKAVKTADVTFPLSPSGESNRVQVQVHRTALRGNPIGTLVGGFFGLDFVDIAATAVAEASPANAMTCVKPFMIPDKWIEKQTPDWDPDDSFEKYTKKGDPLANPDLFIADGPSYTGYSYKNDIGKQLILRAGTGSNINPGFYFSWKMPGDVGGDFYRENIEHCNQAVIKRGQTIIQEPGAMEGPTVQGIEALIDKDPDARWDTLCNCLKGSKFTGQSPRVFPIPLYDPNHYADNQANGRVADYIVSNFLGFFADRVVGNQIYGRITTVAGLVSPTAPGAPVASLATAVRLVQ
jgi:hypothetical protein